MPKTKQTRRIKLSKKQKIDVALALENEIRRKKNVIAGMTLALDKEKILPKKDVWTLTEDGFSSWKKQHAARQDYLAVRREYNESIKSSQEVLEMFGRNLEVTVKQLDLTEPEDEFASEMSSEF